MTFTDEEIIKIMLENDGVYPGDPQMARIYQYNENLYAVFATEWDDDIFLSPFVRNPHLMWQADTGLTIFGKEWLNERSTTKVC